MTRNSPWHRFVLGLVLLGSIAVLAACGEDDPGGPRIVGTPVGNDYFDMLVARPDHWKSYSLRDQDQIDAESGGPNLVATYAPQEDQDAEAQDAMKTVIHMWEELDSVLSEEIDASQTVLPMTNVGAGHKGAFKLDDEIVEFVSRDADSVTVVRAVGGTTASPHSAGLTVQVSNNSLRHQVRPRLISEDGYTYLFTWDSYHTASWFQTGLTNYKAFQFASGGNAADGAIWLEPQTGLRGSDDGCFDGDVHVYEFGLRPYNQESTGESDWSVTDGNTLPPTSTGDGQLGPRVGTFCGKPSVWVRWWLRIEQRENDFDYVSVWMAAEDQEPVQLLDNVGVSVRTSNETFPDSITSWYVELNTSNDSYNCPGRCERDLVTYVRNFVGLRTEGGAASGALSDGQLEGILVRPAR